MADKKAQFVLGSGEYFTAQNAKDANQLRDLGLHEVTAAELHHDDLAKQYSSWLYAPEAAALGVANSVLPGMTGAVMSGVDALSHEQGKMMGDFIEGVSAAHPVAKGFGQVAGAATSLPLSAVATGGKVATVAANAAAGAGRSFDDLALEHIRSPEGGEKVLAAMGISALFSGLLGVGMQSATKWVGAGNVGKLGKDLVDSASSSLETGTPTAFQSWLGKATGVASHYNVVGKMMSGDPMAAAGRYVAGKVGQAAINSPAIPLAEKGLGKAMQAFDTKVAQSLVDLLSKTGFNNTSNLGNAADKLLGLSDFVTAQAGIKWTTENPTLSVPRAAQYMEEEGVPGQVIDAATPQTIKAAQYLDSMAPRSHFIGQTVAPLEWHPTTAQKAEFMDRVNAVNDPVWALSNPNKARMEAVQAVYPILAGRYASILAQEASQRPDLPMAARRAISMVTGQPATPLADPKTQAVLQMVDAQQSKPQGKAQGRQGGGGNSVSMSQTRLGRMSEN